MKKPLRTILDYLALSLIVSTAIVLILIFNGNRSFQMLTVIGLSLAYVIWGLIHHYKLHNIYAQIVLEYVLFAVLGCVIAIGLIR